MVNGIFFSRNSFIAICTSQDRTTRLLWLSVAGAAALPREVCSEVGVVQAHTLSEPHQAKLQTSPPRVGTQKLLKARANSHCAKAVWLPLRDNTNDTHKVQLTSNGSVSSPTSTITGAFMLQGRKTHKRKTSAAGECVWAQLISHVQEAWA
jgi:hypothetical protein